MLGMKRSCPRSPAACTKAPRLPALETVPPAKCAYAYPLAFLSGILVLALLGEATD